MGTATGMWGGATFDTSALHAVGLAAITGVEKRKEICPLSLTAITRFRLYVYED